MPSVPAISNNLQIKFYVGDTHTVTFTVLDPTGTTPLDLTSGSGTLTVKGPSGDITVAGVIPNPGTNGVVQFEFAPNDTAGTVSGTYHYNANVVLADSSKYTIAVGQCVLLPT
jgi:hypothetical protein